jgi:hypothetical protein
MAVLYGRAGRLTAKHGGFRPGQMNAYVAVRLFLEVGVDHQVLPTTLHSCLEVIPR